MGFASGNAMRMFVIAHPGPSSADTEAAAQALAAAQAAKAAGVEIVVVGVGASADKALLKGVVSAASKYIATPALGPAEVQAVSDAAAPKLCAPGACLGVVAAKKEFLFLLHPCSDARKRELLPCN